MEIWQLFYTSAKALTLHDFDAAQSCTPIEMENHQ
jgi:hypothetical protein